LVGNGTEDQQFHRPFEASNRELVEAALQVYIELDERKRTEEALRVSEEKHRLVVENANEAIVVAQDGHIKFFNSKLMEFTTGYLPEELIHTPFTAFIHPEDRPMVMERHLKRLKGEVCPQVYTFRILDKGGRVTWVEINAIRINWEEKPAILFFLSDISERKQAQDRLAESEQRYRQLVKHAPAGIYQIDYVSSRFIDVNDVMCEYTGYSKDEFLALSVLDILTEESKKQFVDRAKKVQAGEPIPETAEFKVKAKNGSEFWVLVNTRVNYEHEQPVSATVIAHNISERRQAEAELEKYRLHLEELVNERTVELTAVNGQLQLEIAERERAEVQIKASLKEKEVLLREIHHRVKNNLQVISSLLNLHSSHLKDQQLQAILQDSQHRVRSMALIHQKLYQSASLAQIDFGEYMLELATYLFRAQDAHARGISLNIRADNIFFDIDKAMPCGLIVNELVSNSLKHAFPSGRPGQICLELHSGPEYLVTLTVADNGVGFPPGLDFRDTESLGLQLVNSLVNQLDGCVELRSEAGVHFTITFGHIRTELSPNQGEA
jgi:PAS domain S-box-containing protein